MKKKTKVLALCSLCAAMGLGIVATAGATMGFDGIGITAAKHDASHVLTEKAYEAPGVGKEGYKPYWHCADCCKIDGNANGARYDFVDKDTQVGLEQIVMAPLTGATEADIADGDEIGTINKEKFKYVDQGINGVDGSGGVSTPLYIKDSGKTALFFSRSGKTGEPFNATDNPNCSEFRFSPVGKTVVSSVTFSYRYLDYGKGVWAGGSGHAEPAGWHSMIQFKDGDYYGKAIEFQNDDTWHEMTLTYKDWESAGNKDATTNFSDLIIKFVDLRGHFMISGLKFNTATTLTLKNTTADGTDVTKAVTDDKLPEAPTMDGKTFIGWYDEEGNKVTSVTGDMTLVARYKQEVSGFVGETIYTFNTKDGSLYSKPEDCENFWSLRAEGNFPSDEASNYYHRPDEGSFVGFRPGTTSSVGVTLPAFDFSKHGALTFTFGGSAGHDNNEAGKNSPYIIDGNAVGNDCDTEVNYTATLRGQMMSVYNKKMDQTFSFTLSDDVYTGKKGLTISTTNAPYRWLLVSSYKELALDYFAEAKDVEAALPETPTKDYLAEFNGYMALRNAFTAYEETAYPVSNKMQAWIDAFGVVEMLSFPDHGLTTVTKSGDGAGNLWNNQEWVDNAMNGTGWQEQPFSLGDNYYITAIGDLEFNHATLTFPAVDFSAKKNVSFTLGFGGNCGKYVEPQLAFGAVPSGTTDLSALDNFIGYAKQTRFENEAWDGFANEITAVVSNGKITFSGSLFSNSVFELSDAINNGEEGLSITIGIVKYEWFVVSPFTGSNL